MQVFKSWKQILIPSLSRIYFLLGYGFLVNNEFIYSLKKLLSKCHVLVTILEVMDKEITKIAMPLGSNRMNGLVGKSDIECKLHNCNEEKYL